MYARCGQFYGELDQRPDDPICQVSRDGGWKHQRCDGCSSSHAARASAVCRGGFFGRASSASVRTPPSIAAVVPVMHHGRQRVHGPAGCQVGRQAIAQGRRVPLPAVGQSVKVAHRSLPAHGCSVFACGLDAGDGYRSAGECQGAGQPRPRCAPSDPSVRTGRRALPPMSSRSVSISRRGLSLPLDLSARARPCASIFRRRAPRLAHGSLAPVWPVAQPPLPAAPNSTVTPSVMAIELQHPAGWREKV